MEFIILFRWSGQPREHVGKGPVRLGTGSNFCERLVEAEVWRLLRMAIFRIAWRISSNTETYGAILKSVNEGCHLRSAVATIVNRMSVWLNDSFSTLSSMQYEIYLRGRIFYKYCSTRSNQVLESA
jgi:hypothetical protein